MSKSSFALGCVEGISAICPSFLFPSLHFSDQRVTPPARSAPRIPAVPGVGTARTVASRQAELLPRRCGGSERRSPPPPPPFPTFGAGTNFVSAEDSAPSVAGQCVLSAEQRPAGGWGEARGALCLVAVCWTALLLGLWTVKEKRALQNRYTASALRINTD